MTTVERRITVIAVVLPFAGFCAGVYLLWDGAINARDVANGTPLHAALFFKHEDVARFLREHGGHQ